MNRFVIILLILVSLIMPVQNVFAASEGVGEGYARPTFAELLQTFIQLKGADINKPQITDEYARFVYCDLYWKNINNDVTWHKMREQLLSRILERKEYFRLKYEVVSPFFLGHYDFNAQFFPLTLQSAMKNVGTLDIFDSIITDCGGRKGAGIFPGNFAFQASEPVNISGLSIPLDKIAVMMARIEEAGNIKRQIYGRIRMVVTGVVPGTGFSQGNFAQLVLKGDVTSIDFFLDPELTEPIGGEQYGEH